MPPKENKNKNRKNRKTNQKSKPGLNKVEKNQVKEMIKSRKEVYYIPTYSYASNRALSSGFKQGFLASQDCFGSSLISAVGLTVGNTPGVVSNAVNVVNNILYPTGGIKLSDGTNTLYPSVPLQGNKLTMKSMKLNMRISALKVTSGSADEIAIQPLEFRTIVFKIKKQRAAGVLPDLTTGSGSGPSMFLNTLNEDVGLRDTQVPWEFANLRTNSTSIEVIRDFKFKLMNPVAVTNHATANTQFPLPTTKDLSFWLPVPKRPVHYDDTYKPENWDYRTFVLTFATRAGGEYQTSTGYWRAEATTISRCEEY